MYFLFTSNSLLDFFYLFLFSFLFDTRARNIQNNTAVNHSGIYILYDTDKNWVKLINTQIENKQAPEMLFCCSGVRVAEPNAVCSMSHLF